MCQKRPLESNNVRSTSSNPCLSTGSEYDSPFLLPIISIMVIGPKGLSVKFNAILDTGSSRSYLSSHVLNKVQCDSDTLTSVDYDVQTFLGSGRRSLKEVTL